MDPTGSYLVPSVMEFGDRCLRLRAILLARLTGWLFCRGSCAHGRGYQKRYGVALLVVSSGRSAGNSRRRETQELSGTKLQVGVVQAIVDEANLWGLMGFWLLCRLLPLPSSGSSLQTVFLKTKLTCR